MTKAWDLALGITWLASMTAEMNQKLVFGIVKTWQAKKKKYIKTMVAVKSSHFTTNHVDEWKQ